MRDSRFDFRFSPRAAGQLAAVALLSLGAGVQLPAQAAEVAAAAAAGAASAPVAPPAARGERPAGMPGEGRGPMGAGPMGAGPMGGPMMDGGPRGAAHHPGGPGMPGPMPGMAAGPGMGPHALLNPRLLEQIGASAEQRQRIGDILRAAHVELDKQRDAERQLHQQLAQVLAAPRLDANAAEALRQKLQAQHEQHSKRMLQAALEAGAVLTPEQRQKLGERMAQRRELMERHRREREALDGAPRS